MDTQALAHAMRRREELLPLIQTALQPGQFLCVEHFPITFSEMENIHLASKQRLTPESREAVGRQAARKIELAFEEMLKVRQSRIDKTRLAQINALAALLHEDGYTVGWMDIEPNVDPMFSEADLKALNFERGAVPKEGALLCIRYDITA